MRVRGRGRGRGRVRVRRTLVSSSEAGMHAIIAAVASLARRSRQTHSRRRTSCEGVEAAGRLPPCGVAAASCRSCGER